MKVKQITNVQHSAQTNISVQRAINHAGRRIDELVYELYGLSEEEVAIVEGRA